MSFYTIEKVSFAATIGNYMEMDPKWSVIQLSPSLLTKSSTLKFAKLAID